MYISQKSIDLSKSPLTDEKAGIVFAFSSIKKRDMFRTEYFERCYKSVDNPDNAGIIKSCYGEDLIRKSIAISSFIRVEPKAVEYLQGKGVI